MRRASLVLLAILLASVLLAPAALAADIRPVVTSMSSYRVGR
ncbi:MAG TPA: hypothetical protein VGK74_13615 [Symbiobacteriaceae bacterium]